MVQMIYKDKKEHIAFKYIENNNNRDYFKS